MLTFIYSTVNAGKSANLLMRSHSCSQRDISHCTFVPEIASGRDGVSQISSRIGFKQEAISLKKTDSPLEIMIDRMVKLYEKVEVIFIDEAQFLTKKQVMDLSTIVSEFNIPIYAFGLRTDFKGNPFEGSIYLMAWSDNIEEITTFGKGGRKALFNKKIDAEGNRVSEGDSIDTGFHYTPVTRSEFNLRKYLDPQESDGTSNIKSELNVK